MKTTKTIVTSCIIIVFVAFIATFNVKGCKNQKLNRDIPGYDWAFTMVTAEPGDTVESVSKEMIEKFNLEDVISLDDYISQVLTLNKMGEPEKQFISGRKYIFPYYMPHGNTPE